MKKIKSLVKYVLILIGLIVIYFSLLYITSLIPSTLIKENVIKSSETLSEYGESLNYNLGYKQEKLFLFTDALMINTAYSIDNNNPLESMLLARKSYIPGQTTTVHEEGKDVKSPERYMIGTNTYQTKELYGLMHNDGNTEAFEYPRYWHGYVAVLRPLLILFDYSTLRMLSCAVIMVLTILLCVLLCKKVNFISGLIYLLSFCSISIYVVGFSLNEITTFYIAIIASIIIALLDKKAVKYAGIILLITGSITSFLDLFTTPLITIGIPLITYLLVIQKYSNMDVKKQIIQLIKLCLLWGVAYAITWVTKWILTDLILGRHILQDAIDQIIFRTSEDNVPLIVQSIFHVKCVKNEVSEPIIVINLLLMVLIGIIGLIKFRKEQIQYKNVIPYIIIAVFPTIWHFIIRQHSSFHMFFTYRIYVILIMTLYIIIANLAGYYHKSLTKK